MEYPEGSFLRGTDLKGQSSQNETLDSGKNNNSNKKEIETKFSVKTSAADEDRPPSTQVSGEHDKNSTGEEDNGPKNKK